VAQGQENGDPAEGSLMLQQLGGIESADELQTQQPIILGSKLKDEAAQRVQRREQLPASPHAKQRGPRHYRNKERWEREGGVSFLQEGPAADEFGIDADNRSTKHHPSMATAVLPLSFLEIGSEGKLESSIASQMEQPGVTESARGQNKAPLAKAAAKKTTREPQMPLSDSPMIVLGLNDTRPLVVARWPVHFTDDSSGIVVDKCWFTQDCANSTALPASVLALPFPTPPSQPALLHHFAAAPSIDSMRAAILGALVLSLCCFAVPGPSTNCWCGCRRSKSCVPADKSTRTRRVCCGCVAGKA